jgi:hypothetical protein
MASAATSQPPVMLTSWKEIASYLGKGMRTVQRWELNYGLPVMRPIGKPKGVVSASREELDSWWSNHWSRNSDRDGNTSLDGYAVFSSARQNMQLSRELLNEHHQLVKQLRATTYAFHEQCRTLALTGIISAVSREAAGVKIRARV